MIIRLFFCNCFVIVMSSCLKAQNPVPISTSPAIAMVELVKEYELGKDSHFFKNDKQFNTAFPQYVFFQKHDLFMFNLERKLNVYNIITKQTESLAKIDSIIETKYPNKGVTGFYVKGDSIYIGLACNKIALFSRKTQDVIITYTSIPSCIDNFSVFNDNTIIAFNADEIYKILPNRQIVRYSTEGLLPEVLIMNEDILAVSAAFGPILSLYALNSKGNSFDLNFGNDDTEMVRFCTTTKTYYIWLNSQKNGLWLYNKQSKKKKLVRFNVDFLNSQRLSPTEDSRDGIRVVSQNDNTFFFIVMRHNKIQIYRASL